ncbi:uncharacterized protein LOC131306760 [Rhododendron vialii]|uniref:uncharacterized protein LOC131306760 n=1 Tax=Rhododendron vialii TaxID=182163 RepID=UPI00265DA7C1|nr:uncharacterized protein LOC131306760 [Rhododendron vialii]
MAVAVPRGRLEAVSDWAPTVCAAVVRDDGTSGSGAVQALALTLTCELMFRLLKKGVQFKCDDKYQRAFDAIWRYLQNPSVLMLPVPRKPLILYLSVTSSSMWCMLAQKGDDGVEKKIYYLRKKMVGCEERYTSLEKDMLGSFLGLQKAKTLHACLLSSADFSNGPCQIYV